MQNTANRTILHVEKCLSGQIIMMNGTNRVKNSHWLLDLSYISASFAISILAFSTNEGDLYITEAT